MEFNKITTAAIAIEMQSVDISQFIKFKEKFNKWIHSSTQLVKGLPKSYYITKYVSFKRGPVNRLCISKLLKQKI